MANPLLTTDNGYIVRKDGSWVRVADSNPLGDGHALEVNILRSLLVTPSDTTKLVAHNYYRNYWLKSTDSGATWTEAASGRTRQFRYATDENGRIYQQITSGVGTDIYKSDDQGVTWASLVSGATSLSVWVSDGYIWWIDPQDSPADTTLHRAAMDGSGATTFSIGIMQGSVGYLSGQFTVNTMYVFRPAASLDIQAIDISDPDNPTLTDITAPFGTERPFFILPISDTEAVAQSLTVATTTGSLWRTTDRGATWTQTQTNTAHLNNTNLDSRSQRTIACDLSNHLDVWAASFIPYVFHSTDGGSTWVEESYDGASLGAGQEWTSVAVAHEAHPGIAVYPADAPGTQVSFTRT